MFESARKPSGLGSDFGLGDSIRRATNPTGLPADAGNGIRRSMPMPGRPMYDRNRMTGLPLRGYSNDMPGRAPNPMAEMDPVHVPNQNGNPFGNGSWLPPGLARQGVTSFTPGQGSPFGGPRTPEDPPSPTAPAPGGVGVPPKPQLPPPPQTDFTRPMFSFLFGGDQ